MKKRVKILFFVIIGPGSVIIYIPCLLLSIFGTPDFFKARHLEYIGIIPILVGITISLWCCYNFLFMGKGTPVPVDPPKKLVVNGLYRFVRNPMYLGILVLLFGESVFFKSYVLLGYAACVFCLFQIFIIGFEETTLRSRFGREYEDYCNTAPRWIFRLNKKQSPHQKE